MQQALAREHLHARDLRKPFERISAESRDTGAGVATATTSTRYPASANRVAISVTIRGSRNVPSNNTEYRCCKA